MDPSADRCDLQCCQNPPSPPPLSRDLLPSADTIATEEVGVSTEGGAAGAGDGRTVGGDQNVGHEQQPTPASSIEKEGKVNRGVSTGGGGAWGLRWVRGKTKSKGRRRRGGGVVDREGGTESGEINGNGNGNGGERRRDFDFNQAEAVRDDGGGVERGGGKGLVGSSHVRAVNAGAGATEEEQERGEGDEAVDQRLVEALLARAGDR